MSFPSLPEVKQITVTVKWSQATVETTGGVDVVDVGKPAVCLQQVLYSGLWTSTVMEMTDDAGQEA